MGRTPITVTHVDALRRGLADRGEATSVGVVRDPPARFERAVDEIRPALGLPAALRADLDALAADFRLAGLCEAGAHNAAWNDRSVADRYRSHLGGEAPAAALDDLESRLRGGEPLLLVDRMNPDRMRSHATVLRTVLEARTDGASEEA